MADDLSDSDYGEVIPTTVSRVGLYHAIPPEGDHSSWGTSPEDITIRRSSTPLSYRTFDPIGGTSQTHLSAGHRIVSSPTRLSNVSSPRSNASGKSGRHSRTSVASQPEPVPSLPGSRSEADRGRTLLPIPAIPSTSRISSQINPISDLTNSFAVPTLPSLPSLVRSETPPRSLAESHTDSGVGFGIAQAPVHMPDPDLGPEVEVLRPHSTGRSSARVGSQSRLGSFADPTPWSDSTPPLPLRVSVPQSRSTSVASAPPRDYKGKGKARAEDAYERSSLGSESTQRSQSRTVSYDKPKSTSGTSQGSDGTSPSSRRAPKSHHRSQSVPSVPPLPPRTIESVRDDAAQSIAVRAVMDAKVVDGTKIGLVETLPFNSPSPSARQSGGEAGEGEAIQFLNLIASKIRLMMKTSSYLFILVAPINPRLKPPSSRPDSMSTTLSGAAFQEQIPVLIIGSDAEFIQRATTLLSAKFVGRVSRIPAHISVALAASRFSTTSTYNEEDDGPSSLTFVHSLTHTTYDHPALVDVLRKSAAEPIDPLIPPPKSLGVRQRLTFMRSKLQRVTPREAFQELTDANAGGIPWPVLLVDIRTHRERERDGIIPGAIWIERNVLEWRFDPRGKVSGTTGSDGKIVGENDPEAGRLAIADRYDLRIILFCTEGYASSFAAVDLHEIGMLNTTDVVGGFVSWQKFGLPVEREGYSP